MTDATPSQQLLDQMIARIGGMTAKQREEFQNQVLAGTNHMKFIPTIGPQLEAWDCKADILLYGGQAGGGKSALLLGLALMRHKRSLIMRRHYSDLTALTEKALVINGTRQGYNGSIPPTLRTADGRLIEFGAAQHVGDEFKWMGRDHDLLGLDEAWQFTKQQVRALIGWVRSEDPKQRCRTVLATNPPLSAEGEWLVEMFGPWLDDKHPNPAICGELRWFVTDAEGKDHEVDGPNQTKYLDENGKYLRPLSRTFIRSSVDDNPFYARGDYKAKLDSLQGPVRASARDGNFMAARKDAEWQVIPSEWVRAAMARWTEKPPENMTMTAMAFDPAGGGEDDAVLSHAYGTWVAPIDKTQGSHTSDGSTMAAFVVRRRRDGATVIIDVGGGYAGATILRLNDNGIDATKFNGTETALGKTSDGKLTFANKRARAYWKTREALDPDQPGGSDWALPNDPELLADLTAPTWTMSARGILIEPKEDIKDRLGRSPGKGDSVTMLIAEGEASIMRQFSTKQGAPKIHRGHEKQRRRW